MKGLGHDWKCILDKGYDGNCTLESIGNQNSSSVSPGVQDAYLSYVLHKTQPQATSYTLKKLAVLNAVDTPFLQLTIGGSFWKLTQKRRT